MLSLKIISVIVNGIRKSIVCDPEETLGNVLRNQLGLTGTKLGCGTGQCGACSVLIDGKVVRSCVKKMKAIPENANIVTIEGIGTPDNLHALQIAWMYHGAAQCGFCTPGFIVSAKALLDENINPTRKEVRDWFQKHRNACRCTGYKPLVDAVMDAAKLIRGEIALEDLTFKLPENTSMLGTKFPRPDGLPKVTGTCDYGHDLILKLPEDTLHMAMVNAKVSHANILSIDISEAEKMPGVHKVITAKDLGDKNVMGFTFMAMPKNKNDGKERPVLCDKKVFQYGDPIALVCADTEVQARVAADKVKVEYELLPAYMSGPEAAAPDAMEIHPGIPNVHFELPVIKGEETGPIMDEAAYVVEGDFYVQRQPHLVLEPEVGFAYTDDEGRITVHTKSLVVVLPQIVIALTLGLPPEKVRIIMNPVGASFGYKLTPNSEVYMAVGTWITGKPVALHYDYAQQTYYTGKRSPMNTYCKLAADKDGKLLAMEHDIILDHGAYDAGGDFLATKAARFCGSCYHIPNIRGLVKSTFTNNAFGTAFRAYGSPQTLFASESLMDELAAKMGIDPFELRYKNIYRPGSTTPSGNELDCHPLEQLMDMMRPKYQEAQARAITESTPELKRGVGISLGTYNTTGDHGDNGEVDLELMPDGTVTVYNTYEEQGQGAEIGTLTAAYEALRPLGLKPEQINLVMNDTAKCPITGAAAASRLFFVNGNATLHAATQLMDAMRKPDGSFRTYQEMMAEGIPVKYRGKFTNADHTTPYNLDNGQGSPSSTYMYAVFMSEVEVNTNTGKVNVLKMTLNTDIGTIGSKLAVDGQMYGGLAQGIGLALSEDFYDPAKHQTMVACGFPYINDITDDLEVNYIQTPRATGPFGAAGCGEIPLTAPHVAIINAINNATGVRIKDLPALPEKVLAGLKSLKK
ncbi:molybdopterin-dependent oxidoreductase [Dehalobacter sp. DCM]|uniref:molybdopterin-dependent aldehyde oxidoreductase n=1 Tax=Dehalobacter sp. DCM TaxID=2907827 RepID=UPI00308158F6|nr:molybdopterin-dependent oxidoreductase [Dehalobacter sp. DCM]